MLINGVLFGLLAVLALAGATAKRSWDELNLKPELSLYVCIFVIAAGIVMWVAGKTGAGIKKIKKAFNR